MGYSGNMYAQATEVITSQGDLRRGDSSGNPERLAIGSSGKVLQSNGTTESWETLTTADSVLTTQGDILYESGSGLARLGQSTDGYVLTTKGASANPVWASAGGGVTTNVQTSEITSNKEITSTSYVTTGITNTLSNQSGGVAIAISAISAVHSDTNIDNDWAYADDGTAVALETRMNNQAAAANRKNPNPTWSMSTDGSSLSIFSKVDTGTLTMIANMCNHVVTEIY